MDKGRTRTSWAALDVLLNAGTLGSQTDGQLLDHFDRARDATGQEAFRILVERHGAMVLGDCRSLVRDSHEAEDAFQATFLVLVRRSGSIRRRETIAPWLYGVACRVARRARVRSARRRRLEVAADVDVAAPDGSARESSGVEQALQEELRDLPDALRAPLILCCLEGQSYDLAARRLGVRESTLRGRIHRARRLLELRLKRRGLLTSTAAGLFEPGGFLLPAPTSSLIESTTQFAARWSSVNGLLVGAVCVPESIATLARGVLHAMFIQTTKFCGLAAVLSVGIVGTIVMAPQEPAGVDGRAGPQAPAASGVADRKTDPAPGPSGVEPRQREEERRREADERPRRMLDERERNAIEKLRQVPADQKRQQILEMLDAEIKLDLPRDATLSAFLKAIKQATSQAKPPGLPIYVDRTGLERVAGKTLESPIDCLDIRSGRVNFLLREGLGQLHLSYVVKDGFLMISSREEIIEQRLDELDKKFDRVLETLMRLERASRVDRSNSPR
jgi:RNA polymerase sigma factor (sigma-70 family)